MFHRPVDPRYLPGFLIRKIEREVLLRARSSGAGVCRLAASYKQPMAALWRFARLFSQKDAQSASFFVTRFRAPAESDAVSSSAEGHASPCPAQGSKLAGFPAPGSPSAGGTDGYCEA